MTKASDDFEKQIKRIHDVLVQDTGSVTWNDKIPDPDNPQQIRQIDISVKRENGLIHIECRHHKTAQDAKWIEELYGRKVSLGAIAMIGVSSSGFTEGAVKKAKRLGIFLCNLSQLTESEVLSWGKNTTIRFIYYTFSNLEICYFLELIKGLDVESVKNDISSKPEYFDIIFNQIKYRLSENTDFNYPYGFRFGQIEGENIDICGRRIIGISVRGDVNRISWDYECPSILSFHIPGQPSSALATVEKSEDSDIEIIISTSGFASVTLDLSAAPQAPPNSVFSAVEFSKLPGSRKYPPKFNIIGSHEQKVHISEANFVVAEIKEI